MILDEILELEDAYDQMKALAPEAVLIQAKITTSFYVLGTKSAWWRNIGEGALWTPSSSMGEIALFPRGPTLVGDEIRRQGSRSYRLCWPVLDNDEP